MTTSKHAWRDIPLKGLVSSRNLIAALSDAKYTTAGALLDATPREWATYVRGLGVLRAAKLRASVIAQVCPPVLIAPAASVVETPPPPRDALRDAAAGAVGALIGICGTLAFLLAFWALWVVTP